MGAGIYFALNSGNLSIVASKVNHNTVGASDNARGGGIFAQSGTGMRVVRSTVSYNAVGAGTGPDAGGGIWRAASDTLSVRSSRLIFHHKTPLNLNRTVVKRNSPDDIVEAIC